MSREQTLYQSRMAGVELRALLYELPWFALGLAAGAGIGLAYARFIIAHRELMSPFAPLYLMLLFALIGLGLVFWAATLYPKTVSVYPDRLHFNMLFGERNLPLELVRDCEALDRARARASFFSLRHRNLTPAVTGAVLIRKARGLDWVINLPEPGEFLKAVAQAKSGR